MSRRHRALLAPLLTALVAMPALARADDFYKGKTVTILVGFSPGGQYDQYARALARFIPSHIPGDPTVIVQNMPGAGSLEAARSLDVTQPKDGTVMVTFNNGLLIQSVVQPQKVNLDFRKYAWIGSTTADLRVCYGFGPNGVKSWDDMMHRKQFILGSTSKGAADYINAATLREVFGAPIKDVLGFPGASEQRLAVERGELDGDCSGFSTIPIEWLRDDTAHPFVRFTEEQGQGVPASARFIDDFATTRDQRDLLDALDAGSEVGRPFVMSGAVPADRIAIIRRAFEDTMKDKGYIAEAARENLPVDPLIGEKAAEVAAKVTTVSPATIAKAKKIFE